MEKWPEMVIIGPFPSIVRFISDQSLVKIICLFWTLHIFGTLRVVDSTMNNECLSHDAQKC